MKVNKRIYSAALLSTALVLLFILVSSTASAANEQGTSSAGTYAYITNYNDDTVSIINTATNTVEATVDVGDRPYGVAVNPAGTKVYVANSGSDTVSVIDTATNKVTATVPVESVFRGIAVNPTGTKVYVVGGITVYVIDAATNTIIKTVPVESGSCGIAVNPTGTKVYVTNEYSENASVIDAVANKVTATVYIGGSSEGVAVAPDGKKAYVTRPYCDIVSAINTSIDKVTASVRVESTPWGVAINPAGTKVYVANMDSNNVSVIDTATNKVTAIVNVGQKPAGVAVNPAGTKAYVANSGSNTVSVIDTATNKVTATVNVGSGPIAFGQFIGSIPEPVRPIANFSAKPTSGKAPLNVSFTDYSTGAPTSWKWSFGDGTNSTQQNPTHKYSKAGNYTVVLTASNSAGSNKITKPSYIKVKPATKPVANFTSNVTSGYAPLNVAFTDKSTGSPTSWKWTFGDGINSTQQNPTHKYSKAGNYTVTLTANNSAGSNKITKPSYIKVIRS